MGRSSGAFARPVAHGKLQRAGALQNAVALFGSLLQSDNSGRCISPQGLPAAVHAPAPLRFQK